MLACEGLVVRLGGREVLAGIDAAFTAGWTSIVGPNGAGKSTLLRALAGLQPLDRGVVRLDGRPLGALASRDRARRLAWLAQQGEATGDLTVRETVGLGRLPQLGLFGTAGAGDARAVDAAMARTECMAWGARRLGELSGGERQRVLLARALATEAPLLLLDEPTTHLDAPHQVALARLFAGFAAEPGRAVLTVLHDLPIALRADRLLVMADGRIAAAGAPAEAAVRDALVRVFRHAIRIDTDAGGRTCVVLALDEME